MNGWKREERKKERKKERKTRKKKERKKERKKDQIIQLKNCVLTTTHTERGRESERNANKQIEVDEQELWAFVSAHLQCHNAEIHQKITNRACHVNFCSYTAYDSSFQTTSSRCIAFKS